MDQKTGTRIRTIWFLTAMIPLVVLTALAGFLSLVLISPLMIYSTITGRHLKDPWRKEQMRTK